MLPMPVTDTPLRYPGGKSQLVPFVIELLKENGLVYGEYAEPFAGGSGIAVKLLLDGYVDRIYLNDVDPAIYCFWDSVLNRTDALCDLIEKTPVTIQEWRKQRETYLAGNSRQPLRLGFATLFLNRTNRSGILKGGVIGGLNQDGDYRLDCRFNKPDLIRKVQRIGSYRERVSLYRLDAVGFINEIVPSTAPNTLVNLDPPYFAKGQELYTNFYHPDDHAQLAKAVGKLRRRWIVTYDDAPEIRELYARFPTFCTTLNYSAQVKRVGTELLVMHPSLRAPASILPYRITPPTQGNAKQVRKPRQSLPQNKLTR